MPPLLGGTLREKTIGRQFANSILYILYICLLLLQYLQYRSDDT